MKLGEALVKEGLITRQQLNLALERQVTFGGRIGTNLLELRILNEEELLNFMSRYLKLPMATNDMILSLSEDVLNSVSKNIAEKYKIIPLKKEGKKLYVAMLNAYDLEEVDELSFVLGYDIIPYAIPELRLLYALEKYYGIKTDPRYIKFLDRFNPDTEVTDSINKVKDAITRVKDEEEIGEILLRVACIIASRVAVFKVKHGQIIGWKARGLDIDRIEQFETTAEELPIFSEVIKNRNFYRGPVLDIRENKPFIEILSGIPKDALVIPIVISEGVVALLYVDNGNDAVLNANIVYLSKFASMAAFALEILTFKRKIFEL